MARYALIPQFMLFLQLFQYTIQYALEVNPRSVTLLKDHYVHQEELTNVLSAFQKQYPAIAKLTSIGKSVQGKDIWVLRITDNVDEIEPGEPKFKYIGNIHGNEPLGRQMLLYLTEYILQNYKIDHDVTNLVDTTDIYIMPSLNPDGFEISKEGDCSSSTGRGNANNVDLDKNFPDQFEEMLQSTPSDAFEPDDQETFSNGDGFPYQPETLAVIKWMNENKFVLSASIHGSDVLVSYPFDDSANEGIVGVDSTAPDEPVFKYLAHTYADTHPTMHQGIQCMDRFEPTDGITNGNKWFAIRGGMQDYNYIYTNCFELTLELSCCKYPPAVNLTEEWENNKDALIAYMNQVHMGVSGFIMDKSTGKGIPNATIAVSGVNKNITSAEFGDYWRLLTPGKYEVTASSEGYEPADIKSIQVDNGLSTMVNFTLSLTGKSLDEPSNMDEFSFGHIPQDYPYAHLINGTDPLKTIVSIAQRLYHFEDHKNLSFLGPNHIEYQNDLELEELLHGLHKKFPDITNVYSIGQSHQGRDLWVIEISDNPGIHEPGKPEFKYIANMHGNEVVGRVMLVCMAEILCKNYKIDPFLTMLIQQTRIHLMPTMNPDGYAVAKEGDVQGITGRANGNGVDLNRNFPDQFITTSVNKEQEPETLAVMSWLQSHPFVLSANLHGGSLVANFPFDDDKPQKSEYSKSPDDAIFIQLAESYSQAHATMHKGHPCPKIYSSENFDDGITNGADWYNVAGGMQDWNYLHTNCFELTLELGCFKYPYHQDLPAYWEANKYALLVLMSQVHKGIKGFIMAKKTGQPLSKAVIEVIGIHHTVVSAQDGDYWRLLQPGIFNVTVSKKGYQMQWAVLTVDDGPATLHNFTLEPSRIEEWSATFDYRILKNIQGNSYTTLNEFDEFLHEVYHDNPDLAILKTIGEMPAGEEMMELVITNTNTGADRKTTAGDKAHVTLISGMQGDNLVGTEMLTRLIRHLVTGYKENDETIVGLLNDVEIHVIPMVNRKDMISAKPGDCVGTSTSENIENKFSEGTKNLQALALKFFFNQTHMDFVVAVSTGSLSVTYPLGQMVRNNMRKKTFETEDEVTLHMLADTYATANPQLVVMNSCGDRKPGGVLHQGEMGEQDGSLMDYLYFTQKTLMISASIACCEYPLPSEIPRLWQENLPSLMASLQSAMQGVTISVENTEGLPISNAQLTLIGDVHSVQPIPTSGKLRRLLPAGEHTLQVTAPGYESISKKVKIFSHKNTEMHVILQKELSSLVYHSAEEMKVALEDITKKCSNVSRLYSIGQSAQGRNLWVLEFGLQSGKTANDTEVRLMSGLHGNNIVGKELLLQIAKSLCESYDKDYITTKLIQTSRIHILPAANPDGMIRVTNGECDNPVGKENANGVDLDNSFIGDHTSLNMTLEPETEAIMNWSLSHHFTLSVNLKAGSLVVSLPYNQPSDIFVGANPTGDDPIFRHLGEKYITFNPSIASGFSSCQDKHAHGGIINGALWNPKPRSFQDWSYTYGNTMELDVYIACCGNPAAGELVNKWQENHQSLLSMIQQAHQGIKGKVKDKRTGKDIARARITVDNLVSDTLSTEDGHFWRILLKGEYHVSATAQGYKTLTMIVQVPDSATAVYILFEMEKDNLFGVPPKMVVAIVASAMILVVVTLIILVTTQTKRGCKSQKNNRDGFHRLMHNEDYYEEDYLQDYTVKGVKKYSDNPNSFNDVDSSQRKLLSHEYHDDISDEEETHFSVPVGT